MAHDIETTIYRVLQGVHMDGTPKAWKKPLRQRFLHVAEKEDESQELPPKPKHHGVWCLEKTAAGT